MNPMHQECCAALELYNQFIIFFRVISGMFETHICFSPAVPQTLRSLRKAEPMGSLVVMGYKVQEKKRQKTDISARPG